MIGFAFTALGWLTGSRFGRYAALAMIAGAAIAYALYTARRSGIKAEQTRQLAKSLKNLRTRIKTDEDISRLEPDARVERLREWSRGE